MAEGENNLHDIFGDTSSDEEDITLEREGEPAADVGKSEAAAAPAAKKAEKQDSDSDDDLELDLSDDSDDDTAARLAALVKEQKKKPRRKSAPKKVPAKRLSREKKPKAAAKIPKRKRNAGDDGEDGPGTATAEDEAFIEKGSDDDDDDSDVIKTKGGWTEDNAIEVRLQSALAGTPVDPVDPVSPWPRSQ